MQVNIYNLNGETVGQFNLDERVWNVPMNVGLVHQVVVGQQANERVGTHSTKTRGFVAGGGKKPYRQKGTGNARQGSRRSPIFKGGGVIWGPHPRKYTHHTPRKVRRAALRMALTDKVTNGRLVVFENLNLDAPRTKDMANALSAVNLARSIYLIGQPETDSNAILSARNLEKVKATQPNGLNLEDLMIYDTLVVSLPALHQIEANLRADRPEPVEATASVSEPTSAPTETETESGQI